MTVALLVMAKAPVPGRSKTRLCPPCTPSQAAELARAALEDTIEAATRTAVFTRRVLVVDGDPVPPLPNGWTVVPQRGDGLDRRLANAFEDVRGPALLVGMDTPQLTSGLLAASAGTLETPGVDVVLGPAFDGGYWAIGFRTPIPDALLGVPMSSDRTHEAQCRRLRSLALTCEALPVLRDVDTFDDAEAVAMQAPGSRFALALSAVRERLPAAEAAS